MDYELASQRAPLSPPHGKPLIVKLDVNIEHWRFDQPMPRKVIGAPHGREPDPDVANFSWHEYGNRVGMARLFDFFEDRGLPVDCLINASVIDTYAPIAERALALGWEFVGHGDEQRSIQFEDDPEDVVRRSLARLRAFSGQPVRGWLGCGLHQTHQTPEHLKSMGVDYVMDWVLDDLPCWMRTAEGPLIAMPYSLELNDAVVFATERHSGEEIFKRVQSTVAVFEAELARQPRILTLPLHPYLSGVPHRFHHLCRAIDLLQARDDTVFMNGAAIADWFIGESPPAA
ncbi:MAG: hypothetical protein KDK91_10055 [Gammaproteobacteria bacterium]|nr:hypothetical protein [Gammaproteobacteria bacterium]